MLLMSAVSANEIIERNADEEESCVDHLRVPAPIKDNTELSETVMVVSKMNEESSY